ncbi:aldehyde reductase [Favolaschia claudopus]|uniref:Aldehyde reductase n=1 Tax=Favolaschia claudopus TaxID=2862362 RepID=A0AAW0EG97_9AGAR
MPRASVKLVCGGGGLPDQFPTEEITEKMYQLLEAAGCTTIDTGRAYGKSEEWLGQTGAGKRFTIDTKTPGGLTPGGSTSDTIPQHAKESVERLKVKSVDVFYIHAPDATVDLEDQLKGINEAYKAGYFKRFGVSNFTAAEIQRTYDICKEKGYPLPTVYQSSYSAVNRRQETEVVPTLRKLGISFYAYSTTGGGLLTKTSKQVRDGGEDASRFAKGYYLNFIYNHLFNKPSYHKALDLWEEAAKDAGCGKAELAYRWAAFHSALDPAHGDAIVFGGNGLGQLEETLGFFKRGPLDKATIAKIDEIWKVVEADSPLDNFHDAIIPATQANVAKSAHWQ